MSQRMLIDMAKTRLKRPTLRKHSRNLGIVLRLIFCFPLGLYAMWTRAPWSKWAKIAVSALVAAVLVVILTPSTNPPERQIGGIVTVDGDPAYTLLGPEAPEDRGKIEIYTPRRTAIIVEATPTPAAVAAGEQALGQLSDARLALDRPAFGAPVIAQRAVGLADGGSIPQIGGIDRRKIVVAEIICHSVFVLMAGRRPTICSARSHEPACRTARPAA